MTFKNITHSLDTFSKELEHNFSIVETLLNNWNLITPYGKIKTTLKYENNMFRAVSLSYCDNFLTEDIKRALLGDFEKHKYFISKVINDEVKDYNLNIKSPQRLKNIQEYLNNVLVYYGLNKLYYYPLYSDDITFQLFISSLSELIPT